MGGGHTCSSATVLCATPKSSLVLATDWPGASSWGGPAWATGEAWWCGRLGLCACAGSPAGSSGSSMQGQGPVQPALDNSQPGS